MDKDVMVVVLVVIMDVVVLQLENVEMILHKGENRKYVIIADSGTYKKKTNDVNLMGNIKFVGAADILMDRLSTNSPKSNSEPVK